MHNCKLQVMFSWWLETRSRGNCVIAFGSRSPVRCRIGRRSDAGELGRGSHGLAETWISSDWIAGWSESIYLLSTGDMWNLRCGGFKRMTSCHTLLRVSLP